MFWTNRMRVYRSITAAALCLGAGLLAGCANDTRVLIENESFGKAVTDNSEIQANPESYTVILGERFAEEVPTNVNFDFDRAALDDAARAILREQAGWIRQFPEVRFKVYGHTDLVGSDAYNQRLGLRRANAVVDYLVGQGIGRDRLEAVASFGKTQPLIQTPDRERRNRRTVTEVTGFVEENPAVLDGKYAQIVYRDYVISAETGAVEAAASIIDAGE